MIGIERVELRLGVYARVSTEEQKEGTTINSQVAELEQFAATMGGDDSQKLLPWGDPTPLRSANLRLHYEINTLTQTSHPIRRDDWLVKGVVCASARTSEAQLQAVWVILGKHRWVTLGARRRAAALRWINNGGDIDGGAQHFGVSRALFNWRVNQTGVVRQLASRAAFLRPSQTA